MLGIAGLILHILLIKGKIDEYKKEIVSISYFHGVLTHCLCKYRGSGEQINLNDWDEKEDTEIFSKDEDSMETFIQAIDNATKMEKQNVIVTEPLLAFNMHMNDNRVKKYHLWITTDEKDTYNNYIRTIM